MSLEPGARLGPYEIAASVGSTRQLFHEILNDSSRDWTAPYAVAPDGQRFLLNVPDTPQPLTYVQNWPALLGRP